MSIDQLTAEAMALSPKERLTLAHTLFESVPEEEEEFSLEFIRELMRRVEELDSGKVAELSHEEVMQDARRALECD